MKNYPQEIRRKIHEHEVKISELKTSELLDYSKSLYRLKLEREITDHLFKKIDERTKYLNSQSTIVVKCKDADMINMFTKETV